MSHKPCLILVSPKGESNLGGIARLMANFDLTDLRLVQHRCDRDSDEVKKMSLQAFSLVENAKTFDRLSEAQADLRWTLALSMRAAGEGHPQRSLFELDRPFWKRDEPWGILLGREDSGLTNEELRQTNLQVSIPSSTEFPSLNIVSAAAVVLSRWFEATHQDASELRRPLSSKPLKREEDLFFRGLSNLLRDIGFLKSDSSTHVLEDLRDIYQRAEIQERDLRILFGILSDLARTCEKKIFSSGSGGGKKSCSSE